MRPCAGSAMATAALPPVRASNWSGAITSGRSFPVVKAACSLPDEQAATATHRAASAADRTVPLDLTG
ncbi:hypothetical protein NWFMUON74_01840 [Nocardia wallacei]|uniref:Uncharacterized protein n=1 Tax=Nocardia wallacei TaxID=480035 RepID=A0A7G1KB94_9NOCA|nr:hypothetical protein NWFMUON74_01840 [Nocardia wallacei]